MPMPNDNERPLLEAVLENGEVFVDAMTDGSVLAEIPVIGTAFKLCKALDAYRDRTLSARLQKFAIGLGQRDQTMAAKWREQCAKSPEEFQQVCETLFLVLERVNDLEKAVVLAKIFRSYIDGRITPNDLRRMAQAIDVSFVDDLQKLIAAQAPPTKSADPWLRFLTPTGLTQAIGGVTWADVGAIYYEVTTFGIQFREAYIHGCKP